MDDNERIALWLAPRGLMWQQPFPARIRGERFERFVFRLLDDLIRLRYRPSMGIVRSFSIWGVVALATWSCGSSGGGTSIGSADAGLGGGGADSGTDSSGNAAVNYCYMAVGDEEHPYAECGVLLPAEGSALLCTGDLGKVVSACPEKSPVGVCDTTGSDSEEWGGKITFYVDPPPPTGGLTAAQQCQYTAFGAKWIPAGS